jgi:hypothetical protein
VPKELSGIVSVAMDGTITIDYDATRAANGKRFFLDF